MKGPVVICNLIANVPRQPIPSTEATCAHCGRAIWLANSTREVLNTMAARGSPPEELVCVPCGRPVLQTCKGILASRHQAAELYAATGLEHIAPSMADILGVPLINLDEEGP